MLRAAQKINHRAKCLNIVRIKLDFDGWRKNKFTLNMCVFDPRELNRNYIVYDLYSKNRVKMLVPLQITITVTVTKRVNKFKKKINIL